MPAFFTLMDFRSLAEMSDGLVAAWPPDPAPPQSWSRGAQQEDALLRRAVTAIRAGRGFAFNGFDVGEKSVDRKQQLRIRAAKYFEEFFLPLIVPGAWRLDWHLCFKCYYDDCGRRARRLPFSLDHTWHVSPRGIARPVQPDQRARRDHALREGTRHCCRARHDDAPRHRCRTPAVPHARGRQPLQRPLMAQARRDRADRRLRRSRLLAQGRETPLQ